jgi:hypothetical protein
MTSFCIQLDEVQGALAKQLSYIAEPESARARKVDRIALISFF